MLRDPDTPIARVALLDRAAERQIVNTVNPTRAETSRPENVVAAFLAAAAAHPDTVAIRSAGRALTYAEVDRLTASAARGIPSGSVVGVAMRRDTGRSRLPGRLRPRAGRCGL